MNDNEYIFQDKVLKKGLDDEKKDEKHIAKVLLLKNELQEKNETNEHIKIVFMEKRTISEKYRTKWEMLRWRNILLLKKWCKQYNQESWEI